MTSSFRNAIQRREHKERAQPLARLQRHGLLEKKKDYVLRARDYHAKQRRIQALQERARTRNTDEFSHGMIRASTKKGVHVAERNDQFDGDLIKLLKSQDLAYVQTLHSASKKRIEKLQASLGFVAAASGTHIVFVEDREEAKTFDPAVHFDTHPDLVERTYNRPRSEQLVTENVKPLDAETVERMNKVRDKTYAELDARLDRADALQTAEGELRIQKLLLTQKGKRVKTGQDARGNAVFKWRQERKK